MQNLEIVQKAEMLGSWCQVENLYKVFKSKWNCPIQVLYWWLVFIVEIIKPSVQTHIFYSYNWRFCPCSFFKAFLKIVNHRWLCSIFRKSFLWLPIQTLLLELLVNLTIRWFQNIKQVITLQLNERIMTKDARNVSMAFYINQILVRNKIAYWNN